ncbi:hypothetical protein C5610_01370 [Idiomarina sp. OT37-5b]|jgi:MSHA biogenesis protein MshJ|uniref:MSHA biogenesis protein MshJ n=1 Tax=Idiomarina aquatica TaxID=1327752 RepID=A0AA94JEZ3_9GAMM|nr:MULTISPECIES: hypothetical protein [Idiomarina]AVJ55063.1 hypothetical protein C5610_01370 [Idiomarina sp. OT37-5b]RUO45406.1 hypothetical protein CWE23_05215 [Idiomarina aquatica]
MDKLLQRWHQWAEQFGELPRERRVLIGVAVWLLVTLPLLSYQLLPLQAQHQRNQQQLSNVEQQLAQQQQSIDVLQQQLQEDINQPLRQQISRKESRLMSLKDVSDAYTLLNKSERQRFLESSLQYPDALQLVTLASQSPQPIEAEDGTVSLYRHQINATYRGNYTELRLFFQQLRELHPEVQWHRFHYQVLDYPQAEVDIVWQLLSVDKEIIGG